MGYVELGWVVEGLVMGLFADVERVEIESGLHDLQTQASLGIQLRKCLA